MGRARVQLLAPLDDPAQLREALSAVAECVQLRKRGGTWSFSEISDPGEAIARLRVQGTTLEPTTILQLARLCEQVMSARAAILAERETSPMLSEIVAGLPRELNSLASRVGNKILPSGELDDRASPDLARIRHDVMRLRSSITRSLENLMRRTEEAVQDELVTIRNDRFVIPVKADHRGHIKGVAHGFSSSGATAFVEPLETIEANNELQSLREAEEREIGKILFGLTEELRQQLSGIEMAADAVAQLDFVNAKAVFHQRFNCVIPEIPQAGRSGADLTFELIEARHPLLEENLRASAGVVVPVSFSLGKDKDSMVIVANISRMLEICQAPALVLLDEVGTGTDPEEGSALGVAVVDHFRRVCGAHVMATTHYSGLKMYAGNEGVLNASVEFDEKTLKPTYRLIVGVAGSSSGLEIARRFGIPDKIVRAASENVKDSSRQATEYLRRIKREAEEALLLRQALEEERAAVAEKFVYLDREAERRERERQSHFQRSLDKTINEIERRSRELVATIQDRSERLKVEREAQRRMAELKREAQHAVSASRREPRGAPSSSTSSRAVRVMRDGQIVAGSQAGVTSLERSQERLSEPDSERYVAAATRDIAVGDRVRLRAFGSVGIVDNVKGDEAEVRVKSLRFREKLENLELVREVAPVEREAGRFAKLRPSRETEVRLDSSKENARSELNVIGQRTDEAVEAVDKFLDEASLGGLSQVRIVHGHGTGALRHAISELLKDHPHVARFTAAPPDHGGNGATVVELRS